MELNGRLNDPSAAENRRKIFLYIYVNIDYNRVNKEKEVKKMNAQVVGLMDVNRLMALWELTETMEHDFQLSIVRGWLMDALYEKLGDEEADKYFGI